MRAQGALTKGEGAMFGLKKKAKVQAQPEVVETYTYSAADYTPHGVSVLFRNSHLWVEPTVWQPSRAAAEEIARQMRREHPEWTVEVVRKA